MDPQNLDEQKCRDIVAAYRSERMPADARAAAWSRLQAAIGEADEAPPVRSKARRRDLMWGAVLVAAAVLLLVVGARARLLQRDAGDAGSQAAHEAAATDTSAEATQVRGGGSVAREAGATDVPEAAPTAPPQEQRPRQSGARAADVPKDMPGLAAELTLLRAARGALGRKDPGAALTSLGQHAREFPRGHLVEERMLLTAQAQCELGRRAEARAAAAELVRAFPDSPHARTVAGLCAE